jgi:hypothetical protein
MFTDIRVGNVSIAMIQQTPEDCYKLTFNASDEVIYYPTYDKAKAMADKVAESVCEYINKENEAKYATA